MKKPLQSFIEDDQDPYLFDGDLTTKKLKGNNQKAIEIAKGQKNIKDYFKKF